MSQDPKNGLLVQIHKLIHTYFDLEEFRDLCFRLGVRYDDLPRENLPARIRELILLVDRRGRLNDLLTFCAHLRPHVTWPDLAMPISLDTAPAPFAAPQRNPRLIFLSYARQDADFAHRLASDLRAHRWDVWIAPDSIRPGEKWLEAINRGRKWYFFTATDAGCRQVHLGSQRNQRGHWLATPGRNPLHSSGR